KTMTAAMIAGAAVLGSGSIASAAEPAAPPAASAGTETSASAADSGTASASPEAEKKFSSIGDFLKNYKGQSLANSQGGYEGECVSLISRALEEVHGVDHGAW